MKRKLFLMLFAVALFAAVPFMANANCLFGCFQPLVPLEGSAEGQAFQHLDVSYGQDAGVQNIKQYSLTKTETNSLAIEGGAYGSLHVSPDALLFVDLNASITGTKSENCSLTITNAKLNTMSGGVLMAADAGASAANLGFSKVSSSAGNEAAINLVQTLPYVQGGYGTTALSASGFTSVNVSSGR